MTKEDSFLKHVILGEKACRARGKQYREEHKLFYEKPITNDTKICPQTNRPLEDDDTQMPIAMLCTICDVLMKRPIQALQHFSGKTHLNKIGKKTEKQKQEETTNRKRPNQQQSGHAKPQQQQGQGGPPTKRVLRYEPGKEITTGGRGARGGRGGLNMSRGGRGGNRGEGMNAPMGGMNTPTGGMGAPMRGMNTPMGGMGAPMGGAMRRRAGMRGGGPMGAMMGARGAMMRRQQQMMGRQAMMEREQHMMGGQGMMGHQQGGYDDYEGDYEENDYQQPPMGYLAQGQDRMLPPRQGRRVPPVQQDEMYDQFYGY